MNKIVAIALVAGASCLMAAPPAQASSLVTMEHQAYDVAWSKEGDPYRYGATGPNSFDCSGLTYYSYRRAGYTLPRTAQEQYDHVHHVPASQRRLGDLVFFGGTHSIYHVGIYAGGGEIWNANTGSYRGYRVVKAPIREYGSDVHYGRP